MPQFTIAQVSSQPPERFTTKAGHTLVAYKIKLENDDRAITINQKPETDPPAIGQQIDGDIEETAHGPKFKKDFSGYNGGGGDGGGTSDAQAAVIAAGNAFAGNPAGALEGDAFVRVAMAAHNAIKSFEISPSTNDGFEGNGSAQQPVGAAAGTPGTPDPDKIF